MQTSKTYRRFIPVGEYKIADMETWLSDMAERGFFLDTLGVFFARFTRDEPKTVRYRLEPAGKDTGYPDLDRKYLYEENGWRFVSPYKKLFHVFMTENAAAPEIHTDPLVQSETLKRMSRQLAIASVVYLSMLAFVIFLWARLFPVGSWVYNLLLGTNMFRLALIPIYLVGGLYIILSFAGIARLRRRLKAGQPFEHHGKRSARAKVQRVLELACYCALVLIILGNIVNLARPVNNTRPLSEAADGIPVLSLADIDSRLYEKYDGGHFQTAHSPLVPEQYTVTQSIGISDGYKYSVLQTEYYKALFPCLAETVYDEMLRSSFARFNVTTAEYEMQEYETLDTPLFDAAAYARIKNGPYDPDPDGFAQYIVARSDKTVIVVRYEGGEDLRDKLAAIADAFLR